MSAPPPATTLNRPAGTPALSADSQMTAAGFSAQGRSSPGGTFCRFLPARYPALCLSGSRNFRSRSRETQCSHIQDGPPEEAISGSRSAGRQTLRVLHRSRQVPPCGSHISREDERPVSLPPLRASSLRSFSAPQALDPCLPLHRQQSLFRCRLPGPDWLSSQQRQRLPS